MRLVPAKCTQCNGNLQVDADKDAAICPYCGTAFVVEKAINLYNATIIKGNQINNYYGYSSDDDIQKAFNKAEGQIKIGQGEAAIDTIMELSHDYPGEYKVWKKLLDYSFMFVETWSDHSTYHVSSAFCLADTMKNARSTCPPSDSIQLENYIDGFFNRVYNSIIRGEKYITRLLGYKDSEYPHVSSSQIASLSGLHRNIDRLLNEGRIIANRLNENGICFYSGRVVFADNVDLRAFNVRCSFIWLIGKEMYCFKNEDGRSLSYIYRHSLIASDTREFYKRMKEEAKRNRR